MSEWFPTFRNFSNTVWHTPLRDLLRLQLSGRLNWKARVAESGLSAVAQQKIVDVVKATRLWPLEKSQIADELIAHFQDGNERGENTDELIAKFGETKTVAPLMRSSKKRNRSWLWKSYIYGGRAFAVFSVLFLVFYAGLAIWFFSGEPNPKTDYFKVLSAKAAAVPEDQRAWPIYREAWIENDLANLNPTEIIGIADEDESWHSLRPGDEKWPNVVKFLDDHKSLVTSIRRGGQLSGFGLEIKRLEEYSKEDLLAIFGPDAETVVSESQSNANLFSKSLVNARFLHVQNMRILSRTMEADVFRSVEANEPEQVTEDLMAMIGLGPQAAEVPVLVSGLVGVALDGMAYNTITEVLENHPDLLGEQQLKSLAEKIAAHSPRDLIQVKGEIAFHKDLIQRMYSDDGQGDGRLTDEGVKLFLNMRSDMRREPTGNTAANTLANLAGPGVAFMGGSRKGLENAVDGVIEEMVADLSQPLNQQMKQDPEHFEKLLDRHVSNPIQRAFLGIALPAVHSCAWAGKRTECNRNATMIGVAAYRFHKQNGRFPETAEELTPDFLSSIPIDVITGAPLRYRLQNGKPLIYSVGQDGDDDGGVTGVDSLGNPIQRHKHVQPSDSTLEGDWVLWPLEDSE